MKASELRLGNLFSKVVDGIHYGDYVVTKINQDNLVNERGEAIYIGYCEPIPLTEEWLLKFGFEWLDDLEQERSLVKSINGRIKIVYYKGNAKFLSLYQGTDCVVFPCAMHIYVHQLQNLYFALTGEELTIKE